MSSLSLVSLRVGTVVEYIQHNQPVMGWVQQLQSGRARLVNSNQREIKLPVARLLPWTGPCLPETSSRNEILHTLKTLHAHRETLGQAIDPLELWELAQGEIDQASIEWLAALLWDTPDIDQKAALGRRLLAAKTYFKFAPPHFVIYPQETVAKRTEEMRRAQERERLVSQGQALFKALWQAHKANTPCNHTLEPDLADPLKQFLLDRLGACQGKDTEALWKKMTAGLPDLPFLALHLAETWGIVPQHYNYLLDQAGYAWEDAAWSAPFVEEVRQMRDRVLATAQPVTCNGAVSIDSSSTRDIDDGFRVSKQDDGYHLDILLACPAWGWEFGSDLDKAVMDRFSSVYLPEGTANMLPLDLGNDFFSLHAGQNRPALRLHVHLDEQGHVLDYSPQTAWVCLHRNLTYSQVQDNLDSDQPEPMLAWADELAQHVRARRMEQGAVIMQQPDPVITLTASDQGITVNLEPGREENRAQALVSEYMILANSLMARWAINKQLPLIFRTQNLSLPKGSAGIWSAPCDIFRLIKCMGPSILEAQPGRHATLAVDAYASVTSPLRRYTDFINMAQIVSCIRGEEPPWSQATLEAQLPYLSARAQAVGAIQRLRPRYWKYLFFQQQGKQRQWVGEIVDHNDRMVTVSLRQEQLFLKAPTSLFGDNVCLGQQFALRMGKVDPLHNELRIAEALPV
ncbi:MAG: ribonuclease II [Deltaproteobacteria bacterium]|nr:MAG: ribonuclease II [Deltaproteobacteria bacterium]